MRPLQQAALSLELTPRLVSRLKRSLHGNRFSLLTACSLRGYFRPHTFFKNIKWVLERWVQLVMALLSSVGNGKAVRPLRQSKTMTLCVRVCPVQSPRPRNLPSASLRLLSGTPAAQGQIHKVSESLCSFQLPAFPVGSALHSRAGPRAPSSSESQVPVTAPGGGVLRPGSGAAD